MELPNQAHLKQTGRRKLNKSTGEPIDDEDTNNNEVDQKISNRTAQQQSERKKLSQIRSFFNKSLKINGLGKQPPVNSELSSDRSTNDAGLSSSDEWHLLEPDEPGCESDHVTFSFRSVRLKDQHSGGSLELTSQPGGRNSSVYHECRGPTEVDNGPRGTYMELEASVAEGRLWTVLAYLCAGLYALVPLGSLCVSLGLICCLWTRFWPLTLIYLAYLSLDSRSFERGGRRLRLCYESRFWTYLAAYFPIKLRYPRSFHLDPEENYILACHPDGTASFRCVAGFATNGLNFNRHFPGISTRLMVDEATFCVPLMREICSLRGDCSTSSTSFDYILEKKNKQPNDFDSRGNLLAVVPNGPTEVGIPDPKVLKIGAGQMKDLVRRALVHGAHLVPCLAFGESSVHEKSEAKWNFLTSSLGNLLRNLVSFKHLSYCSASLKSLSKFSLIIPHKRPMTLIMGNPIIVSERTAHPTQQQVDQLHRIYLQRVEQLYNANSDLCTKYDLRLEIVQ